MKRLRQVLFLNIMLVLMCSIPLFAGEQPLKETLQAQMDAMVWEINYCRQRAIVLQYQAQELQKQIEALSIAELEAREALKKQEEAVDAPSDQ